MHRGRSWEAGRLCTGVRIGRQEDRVKGQMPSFISHRGWALWGWVTTFRGDSHPPTSSGCSELMTLQLMKRCLQFTSLSRIISVSERLLRVLSFNNEKWGIKKKTKCILLALPLFPPHLPHVLSVLSIHTSFLLRGPRPPLIISKLPWLSEPNWVKNQVLCLLLDGAVGYGNR